MHHMLPYTLDEAIQEIGEGCTEQKIIDLIISGQLEACFRYDGIIGIMNGFIPFIHNDMDSSMLRNEILDTARFEDWLIIEKQTKGFHELLYKKLASIKITNSFGKFPSIDESKKFSFVLLDQDIDFYELVNEVDNPEILPYDLTFNDLRISVESLNNYIYSLNSTKKTKKSFNLNDESQLSTLLDAAHPYYAPDLALAVQLWIECYKDQKPYSSSHESTVNDFLKRNYEEIEMATKAKERIQEISSPFKNWGSERKKRSNHVN